MVICQGHSHHIDPGIPNKNTSARVVFQFITLAFFNKSHLPGSFPPHPTLANRQNGHLPGAFFISQPWHSSINLICQGHFHLIHPWQIVKMVICQGHCSFHNPGKSLKCPFARVTHITSTLAFPKKPHLPGSLSKQRSILETGVIFSKKMRPFGEQRGAFEKEVNL